MPSLQDLEPQFLRYELKRDVEIDQVVGDPDTWRDRGCPTVKAFVDRETYTMVETLAEAQGIMFVCPVCTDGHRLTVTFSGRGVPDDLGSHDRDNKPSRWVVSGTDYSNLTLTPSIDIGCWHGYLTNGVAK